MDKETSQILLAQTLVVVVRLSQKSCPQWRKYMVVRKLKTLTTAGLSICRSETINERLVGICRQYVAFLLVASCMRSVVVVVWNVLLFYWPIPCNFCLTFRFTAFIAFKAVVLHLFVIISDNMCILVWGYGWSAFGMTIETLKSVLLTSTRHNSRSISPFSIKCTRHEI